MTQTPAERELMEFLSRHYAPFVERTNGLEELQSKIRAVRDRALKESAQDTRRLEWLLPRQFNHQTRESIDAELRDNPITK